MTEIDVNHNPTEVEPGDLLRGQQLKSRAGRTPSLIVPEGR